jgi:hypothetical protein
MDKGCGWEAEAARQAGSGRDKEAGCQTGRLPVRQAGRYEDTGMGMQTVMQKQSVRGRQREAQAASLTRRNAGRQSGKCSQLRQVGMQPRIEAGAERSRQYRQTKAGKKDRVAQSEAHRDK